jgi:hypothetical protein
MPNPRQRYLQLYTALQKIAKEFLTAEELHRRSEKLYGLPYHEALEMAYDNMQNTAKAALRGIRRPKDTPDAPTP